jgi:hypothetical protein
MDPKVDGCGAEPLPSRVMGGIRCHRSGQAWRLTETADGDIPRGPGSACTPFDICSPESRKPDGAGKPRSLPASSRRKSPGCLTRPPTPWLRR